METEPSRTHTRRLNYECVHSHTCRPNAIARPCPSYASVNNQLHRHRSALPSLPHTHSLHVFRHFFRFCHTKTCELGCECVGARALRSCESWSHARSEYVISILHNIGVHRHASRTHTEAAAAVLRTVVSFQPYLSAPLGDCHSTWCSSSKVMAATV